MSVFGEFHNVVRNPKEGNTRKELNYAVVLDGKLIATNGMILVASDISVWVDSPELAEGKAFNHALLSRMALKKWKKITIDDKGVYLYSSYGSETPKEFHFYSATNEKSKYKKQFNLISKSGDIENESFIYVDWKTALPEDLKPVERFCFNPELLHRVSKCFYIQSAVNIEFAKETNSHPLGMVFVKPIYSSGEEIGLIMPYNHRQIKKKW